VEESGKKRLAFAAAAVFGIAYFLVAAVPLGKQLVLVPIWARDLRTAPPDPGASPEPGRSVHSYRMGGGFGYFDSGGTLLFSSRAAYGVALSDEAFAAYDRLSAGFSIRAVSGREQGSSSLAGYPFFAAGRRFVLAPDQCAVAELAPDGSTIWERRFGSVITAFGASPSLAVFGLMEGRLFGIDPRGEERLSFEPGGSRIAGVYGLAVSPDGEAVAALCGLDKQRLVVMEKRSSDYRVAHHRWLETDYRRPVTMGFSGDGQLLVYESEGGAAVFDRGSGKEYLVDVDLAGEPAALIQGSRILAFLSGAGGAMRLVCASPEDKRLVDLPLRASAAFLDTEGRSFFLGLDEGLIRLDLREE